MSEGLNELVRQAKEDRQFLFDLLEDPQGVAGKFDLTDQELASIGRGSVAALSGLVDLKVLKAGCGSSGTCTQTCSVTCTVTFTSISDVGGRAAR